MTVGWQCVDMAVRCLAKALQTPEFQSARMVHVGQVIREEKAVIAELVAHYTAGQPGASMPTLGEDQHNDAGSVTSPDADAQPDSES
jgi:hypothetical protein